MAIDFVSFPAFAIAIVINVTMGAIWYDARVFGKAFLRLAHSGQEPEHDVQVRGIQAAGLGSMTAMPLFCLLLRVMGCTTGGQGALFGLIMGLVFSGGLNAGHTVFDARNPKLQVLHTGYHAVSLALVGATLGQVCA